MNDIVPRILLPLGFVAVCIFVLFQLTTHTDSADNYVYFGGFFLLEILVVVLADYRKRFFPFLLFVFLAAGVNIPLRSAFGGARWVVLFVGAIVGVALYLRDRSHTFGVFHLIALFAVIAALVSAFVSSYPQIALLKTTSLWLVFLYGAAGARLAIIGREAKLLLGLLWGCEVVVFGSAFSYGILNFPFYGNPNSLGVVMGVVCVPILLWGILVGRGTKHHKRRVFALILCLLLLLSSYARAAIVAAIISSVLLCLSLRQYRILLKGIVLALMGALLIATVRPLPKVQSEEGATSTIANMFLYKGEAEPNIFASRSSPWEQTSKVIAQNPWFGSGFGTSVTDFEQAQEKFSFRSIPGATREHGNSYLAILEWTGLLGVVPFYLMVCLILFNVGRVVLWMRRSGSPFSPAVPVAAVLAGGVVHAAFEDWMFAPGYYMCIFFWVFAFVVVDVLPLTSSTPMPLSDMVSYATNTWNESDNIVVLNQQ